MQWHRRDEEAFGLFKSRCRRIGPRQSFWVALQEVSERFENLCTVGKERAVKVYHAEETLQLLDVLRGGTLWGRNLPPKPCGQEIPKRGLQKRIF